MKDDRRRAREPGPVIDARVAIRVHEQRVPRAAEPGYKGEVCLVPGREDDRVAFAEVGGELVLELRMDRQRAIGCARPGCPGAVAIDCVARRGADLGMERQAQIVVRPEHQYPASSKDDFRGPGHLVEGGVTRARSLGPELRPSCRERAQLVEQVDARAAPNHNDSRWSSTRLAGWTSIPAA
jgi:hypothetical protein